MTLISKNGKHTFYGQSDKRNLYPCRAAELQNRSTYKKKGRGFLRIVGLEDLEV